MKKLKWEALMREQVELKKAGIASLHRRITLLVACYDDLEFRAWCEASDVNDLDRLDAELSDVAVGFLTLKAVLIAYPDVADWQKHCIRDLIAETMAKDRAAVEPTVRKSWKAIADELQAECERLRAEVKMLRESLGIVAGAKCG